jgi:hypothetical protein
MNHRTLVLIPIIHTAEDLGSFNIKPKTIARRVEFERKQNLIKKVWDEIEKNLLDRQISFENTFIYQDSLPVCGRELEIVREVAATGSPNYRLILKLIEQGAEIIGTESPELLKSEYEVQAEFMKNPKNKSLMNKLRELLFRRDRFIADRINDTLLSDKLGILFIGMMHQVETQLPEDIKVVKGKLQ